MEISINKNGKKTVKVPLCRYCGQPMLWSFCLPFCEYVCVPCGDGVGMLEAGDGIEMPKEEIDALREKYKEDLHKKSYETAKAGGGKCSICGTDFTCKECQRAENHEYEFWGKGSVKDE